MRRSAPHTMPRFGHAMNAISTAMPGVATETRVKLSKANDWSRSAETQPVVAVGSRSLTQQAPVQLASHATGRSPGKAQSALPSCRSGAAAAEYGSRYWLHRAPVWSAAEPSPSNRSQRGAGSARRVLGNPAPPGLPSARPNPSLKLTRYGRLCKASPRYPVHLRGLALQSLPPRAA
jgi:hypothetical protein